MGGLRRRLFAVGLAVVVAGAGFAAAASPASAGGNGHWHGHGNGHGHWHGNGHWHDHEHDETAETELFAMNALAWRTHDGNVVIPNAWVRLTDADTDVGVPGREVVLTVGAVELCRATTGPAGWAHCGGTVAGDGDTIADGYDASFAGDADHGSSDAHGTLFELRRRCPHRWHGGHYWGAHWQH